VLSPLKCIYAGMAKEEEQGYSTYYNNIIYTEQVHPSAEEFKVGDTVEVRLYAKNTQIVEDFSSV
jgi:hypothetical protein